MIALVDYGAGNLRSVEKAIQSLGAEVVRATEASTLREAQKVILPGVGAFGDGMRGLEARGLVEALVETVTQGKPFLGICLGMQLLLEQSVEHGVHQGLGLLPGQVLRFPDLGQKIPQIGWNRLTIKQESPLFRHIPPESYAYFNHSFYCRTSPQYTVACTHYGIPYAAAVWRDRLYGVQFHPEKSQKVGLRILRNFLEYC